MDHLEGYCDGISGKAPQPRTGEYLEGHALGLSDLEVMQNNS